MEDSSPFCAWDPSYAVGIPVIDEQHERLIGIVDHLCSQIQHDGPTTVSAATAAELEDYAQYHFTTEEAIYRKGAFPLLHEHEALHLDFIVWIAEMQIAISHSGYSAFAALGRLREWWLDHIQGVDRAAAASVLAGWAESGRPEDPASAA